MQKSLAFLKTHLILVLLICLATFLRTHKLDTHGILFYDAGHDLLTAYTAWEDKRIPLVGITSSRPWLHQGPISLWIELFLIAIFGPSTLVQSLTFALFGIAAIIALYELITIHLSKKAAYFAVALLAVMPLAVAHSRVPYHTTPIPLFFVLYLWSLLSVWQQFSYKKFIVAIIAGIILFQFELAHAPLLILIPYLFWRTKQKLNRKLFLPILLAVCIGLLPQLLYSLTGGTNQILEFSKWAITQALERMRGAGSSDLASTLHNFFFYWGRIFGTDSVFMTICGLLTLSASLVCAILEWKRRKLPVLIELTVVSFFVLTISYFVVGSPSEAYFPSYFIIFPTLIGYFFTQLPPKARLVSGVATAIFVLINTISIIRLNYFVMNQTAFRYDSVGEHRQIAYYLHSIAGGPSYRIATGMGIEKGIPAFFDHIRWIAVSEKLSQPGTTGRLYYVEGMDQPPPFQSVELKRFSTKVIYWFPEPRPQKQ